MRKIESPKTIEERKIYAYHKNGVVYVLQHLRNIYGFKPILRGYELSEYSSFASREAIENAIKGGKEILEAKLHEALIEARERIERKQLRQ